LSTYPTSRTALRFARGIILRVHTISECKFANGEHKFRSDALETPSSRTGSHIFPFFMRQSRESGDETPAAASTAI
jgi:hypothetical protein